MKTLATLNVVAWSMFWVFAFLAVTEDAANAGAMVFYSLLSFAGLAVGIGSYLKICREGHAMTPRATNLNEV